MATDAPSSRLSSKIGDPRGERFRRERVAQVVRTARADTGSLQRRPPVARPGVVQVDVAALRCREDQSRVDPSWKRVKRTFGPIGERHPAAAAFRLRVIDESAVRVAALHNDGAVLDVATLECDQLSRP